jgi:hypothetical protein
MTHEVSLNPAGCVGANPDATPGQHICIAHTHDVHTAHPGNGCAPVCGSCTVYHARRATASGWFSDASSAFGQSPSRMRMPATHASRPTSCRPSWFMVSSTMPAMRTQNRDMSHRTATCGGTALAPDLVKKARAYGVGRMTES